VHLLGVSEPLVCSLSITVPPSQLWEGFSPPRACGAAAWPLSSLPQAQKQAAVSPPCPAFAQARYESVYRPFREDKNLSAPGSPRAMGLMSAPSQRYGGSHLRRASARREIGGQRPGVQGEGAAAGADCGAGKGGEVQSSFSHATFLLSSLVQSQTRRGMMSQ